MTLRNVPKGIELTQVFHQFGRMPIRRLRNAASSHTLDSDSFMENNGMGGATYDFKDVPRAVVSDDKGDITIFVEAYKAGDGIAVPPPCVTMYSAEPKRARKVLANLGYNV